MNEKNNVSCRNINIIAEYVKRKIGSDTALLCDLPYSPEYLKNEHRWITLALYNEIMERAIGLLRDPKAAYKIGLSALSLGSWGLFRYVQLIFLADIRGPIGAYRKIKEYNPHFNDTKTITITNAKDDECILKIKFKDDIDPVDDFHSDSFIQGLIASIPKNWSLPYAEVESITKEYDLVSLLKKIGGVSENEIELRERYFSVCGRKIGKQVRLADEGRSERNFGGYDDSVREDFPDNSEIGILITQDFAVNDRLFLYAGEIYNAPYFLYRISWKPLTLMKKIKHLLFYSISSKRAYLDGMESSLATIQNYVRTLEEKVAERTKQLDWAKSESEYWRKKADKLLFTMLPEHIVKTMIDGKLKAEEMEGTVMYTDLADFSTFSKKNSPQTVERELTRYFTELSGVITSHGGWVNKFLGDGILVVFGLDKNPDFTENAVRAAMEIEIIAGNYPWSTRIGIATGTFIVGEFGSDNLRRFDCVGHTLNLGSRLQGLADSGQTLVCQNTYKKLAGKGYRFSPMSRMHAKGIGEVFTYPLIRETR